MGESHEFFIHFALLLPHFNRKIRERSWPNSWPPLFSHLVSPRKTITRLGSSLGGLSASDVASFFYDDFPRA